MTMAIWFPWLPVPLQFQDETPVSVVQCFLKWPWHREAGTIYRTNGAMFYVFWFPRSLLSLYMEWTKSVLRKAPSHHTEIWQPMSNSIQWIQRCIMGKCFRGWIQRCIMGKMFPWILQRNITWFVKLIHTGIQNYIAGKGACAHISFFPEIASYHVIFSSSNHTWRIVATIALQRKVKGH